MFVFRHIPNLVRILYGLLNSTADSGSGAFLTPVSGIRDGYKIMIRIWDEQPRSYFRDLRETIFGVRILKLFCDADPGMEESSA
jgi:hypothetical protein